MFLQSHWVVFQKREIYTLSKKPPFKNNISLKINDLYINNLHHKILNVLSYAMPSPLSSELGRVYFLKICLALRKNRQLVSLRCFSPCNIINIYSASLSKRRYLKKTINNMVCTYGEHMLVHCNKTIPKVLEDIHAGKLFITSPRFVAQSKKDMCISLMFSQN